MYSVQKVLAVIVVVVVFCLCCVFAFLAVCIKHQSKTKAFLTPKFVLSLLSLSVSLFVVIIITSSSNTYCYCYHCIWFYLFIHFFFLFCIFSYFNVYWYFLAHPEASCQWTWTTFLISEKSSPARLWLRYVRRKLVSGVNLLTWKSINQSIYQTIN